MAGGLVSRWSRTPGGRVHVRVNREPPQNINAPAVILVHGLIVSGRYMEPTAELLAASCRVYVPDLPGYGLSYKPRPMLPLRQRVDALVSWMDSVGLAQATLVGNSFGCQMLVDLAVRYPERVVRLVLQGPTRDPAASTVRAHVARMLMDSIREPVSLVPIMLEDYRLVGTRRALHLLRDMLQHPIEENLPKVEAPTMVVRGTKDPVAPRRWVEEIVRLLPNGQLREVPGGTHDLNYANPQAFTRVISPFLQSLSSRSNV